MEGELEGEEGTIVPEGRKVKVPESMLVTEFN